jgi:hypothetical protein
VLRSSTRTTQEANSLERLLMEVGLYDVRADRLRLVRDEHGP